MRRNGEDIIITATGEMKKAREAARKLSSSKHHGWTNIYYIDSATKRLACDTYCDGVLYSRNHDQARFPGNVWYQAGKTTGLTILDAILRYAQSEWIAKHAKRLGATGKYTRYAEAS